MAKKKSSRAKTGAKRKTTVKDLAPKKSARGGAARLNATYGNTIGSALGGDSLRSS